MLTFKINEKLASRMLGADDINLKVISKRFNCKITYDRNTSNMCIEGYGVNEEKIQKLFSAMTKEIGNSNEITDVRLLSLMSLAEDEALDKKAEYDKKILCKDISGHSITPLTVNQHRAVEAFENSKTVFLEGEAGTGKTMIAMAWALGEINSGKVKKLCICKPVNTVGDDIGYLPGTIAEKNKPTEASFDDKLAQLVGSQKVGEWEKSGKLERVPVASIRGRSFDDCIVIIDEAQNFTADVLKAVATRQGNSKFIFCGDGSQSDLNRRRRDEWIKKDDSTYTQFVKFLDLSKRILQGENDLDKYGYTKEQLEYIKKRVTKSTMLNAMKMETIDAIYFEKKDVLRSFEVVQMLELFDNYDSYMDMTHSEVKKEAVKKAESIEESNSMEMKR